MESCWHRKQSCRCRDALRTFSRMAGIGRMWEIVVSFLRASCRVRDKQTFHCISWQRDHGSQEYGEWLSQCLKTISEIKKKWRVVVSRTKELWKRHFTPRSAPKRRRQKSSNKTWKQTGKNGEHKPRMSAPAHSPQHWLRAYQPQGTQLGGCFPCSLTLLPSCVRAFWCTVFEDFPDGLEKFAFNHKKWISRP